MKTGSIEYIMTETMATDILKTRKGEEKKMSPKEYLKKYVDENCGLLRQCTKVTVI